MVWFWFYHTRWTTTTVSGHKLQSQTVTCNCVGIPTALLRADVSPLHWNVPVNVFALLLYFSVVHFIIIMYSVNRLLNNVCVSEMAVRVIGTERHKSGITSLFELLQQPRLNKQVDILIGAPPFYLSR